MSNMLKWLNYEIKFRFIFFALLLIIVGVCTGHLSKNYVMRQYDAVRLAIFAHRIADADRVVVTWGGSPVSLTFTGDDAQKIVRAVSSAASARMPDAELALKYSERVAFYKGTDALGEVEMAYSLFLLKFREPPFCDRSGTLNTLVSTPFEKAVREFWRTNDASLTTQQPDKLQISCACFPRLIAWRLPAIESVCLIPVCCS
jgi:hypothetical protein